MTRLSNAVEFILINTKDKLREPTEIKLTSKVKNSMYNGGQAIVKGVADKTQSVTHTVARPFRNAWGYLCGGRNVNN